MLEGYSKISASMTRQFVRAGQRVLGPVHRLVLDAGIVGIGRFVQRVGHTHESAADDLAFDQLGIYLHGRLRRRTCRLNTSTSPVSVSTSTSATTQAWASVESGSIAPVSGSTIALRFHEHAAAGDGARVFEVGGQGQIDDMNGAIRLPFDFDQAAAVRFQVGGIGFQLIGRNFQHDLARFRGRFDDGIADAMGGTAGERAHTVRAGVACRPCRCVTFSKGMPKVSAAIWAMTVFKPLAQIGAGQ